MAKKRALILSTVLLMMFASLLGVRYYFRETIKKQVSTSEVKLPQRSTVVVVGDMACDDKTPVSQDQCHFTQVVQLIEKISPDKVLLLGDLQYQDGRPALFSSVFGQAWSSLKSKSLSIPGNHEYMTKNAQGYFDYWNGQEQSSVQAGDRAKGYFSAIVNGWKIIALNSNCEYVACGEGSEQYRWLESELATSSAQCTLAMWHHPRFTSGKYANDTKSKDRTTSFWELLDKANADVILNGHDHIYERFAKQHADQSIDQSTGTRQFTVGTGGRSLYPQVKPSINQDKIIENRFGVLTMTLSKNSYDWKFIDENGNMLDSGFSRCNNGKR